MPLYDPGPVHPPEWDDDLYGVRLSHRRGTCDESPASGWEKLLMAAVTLGLMLTMLFVVILGTLAVAMWGMW